MNETTHGYSKWDKFAQTFTVLLAPLALLAIVLLIVLSLWPAGSPRSELDIIAHRQDAAPGFWDVSGRVRQDGNDAAGARVWLIAEAAQGDRDSPADVVTGTDGQFMFTNLPKKLDGRDVWLIKVHAKLMKDHRELDGLETLRSDGAPLSGNGPAAVIGSLAGLLLLSMLLPLLGGTPGRTRYVLSMVLAVLFNFSVIGGLGYAMYKVHSIGNEARVPVLGFISIFQGTYIEDGPKQWLISLTDQEREAARANSSAAGAGTGSATPPEATPSAAASTPAPGSREQGFGAPLWVLLLAAVGSGILTVSLITREIREPPDHDLERIREKIYNAVQNEVYILFSPICAIFIYQTMVVTSTAGQSLVVAIATLGAGAALNVLLKYAVESATALFTKDTEPSAPVQARAATGPR